MPERTAPVTTRTARLVATSALAVLALAGCGGPVRAGAAVVVGDTRISTAQFADRVEQGLADPAAASLADDRAAYQRDVLGRIVAEQVVDVAAARTGVDVTPADVDAQYAALERSVGGPEELRSQAAAAGLTPDRVRALARTRAVTIALGDELTRDVPVPDAQLQQAYEAAADTYEQVRVAQVQLPTPAEAQALRSYAAALTDEQFADLARTRSTDPSTRERGGDLGLQPRSAFVQNGLVELATQAFTVPVGTTFAVPGTDGTGLVVRVLDRQVRTLAEVTPELRRAALQQQRDTAVQDLLARTADSLRIQVNPRFGAWSTSEFAVVERPDQGARGVSVPAGGTGDELAPQG